MSPRLPPLNGPPIGFGHRRATASAENIIDNFRQALDMGATGVESRVWITADGVAVLDHLGRVGPRLRRRPIADLERDRLPDHIPSLGEVFGLVGPGFPVALDVEDPRAFHAVIELARGLGAATEENVWLCHSQLPVLTDWRPRTTARLVNSIQLKSLTGGLERRAAELQQRGVDGLKLFHRDWSGGRIALMHRFGLLSAASGVEYEREVAEVVNAGIDAVSSGHVDRMMAVINEYYRASPG